MSDKVNVNYSLKDFDIFYNSNSFDVSVWIPDKSYIVLGRANNIDSSVFKENAIIDGVEILKRPSGGETVILSPKTVVISVKLKVDDVLKTHTFFHKINKKIIEALDGFNIKDLRMNGISDISIGQKKILGSSIYRYKQTVFYHAVLNISEPIETFERYLKHPKREPEYRKGRNHNEFVTSLKNEGYKLDIDNLKSEILSSLNKSEKTEGLLKQESC